MNDVDSTTMKFIAAGQYLYHCLLIGALDVLVFACVDKVCKLLLSNCRDDSERKDIWLFEALLLFGLSAALYYYHHMPLLLWLFASLTFVFATLSGKYDFSLIWENMKTYWYEFKEQEDMDTIPQSAPQPVYTNKVSEEQCREFMQKTSDVVINNQNAVDTSAIGEGLKTLRYNEKKAAYEFVPPKKPQHSSNNKPYSYGTALRRRALHPSDLVSQAADYTSRSSSSVMESLENIGNKVWNAFGLNSSKTPVPPGLINSGSNLCFFNSVLQCIARSPNLASELAEQVKSCQCQDKIRLTLMDLASVVLLQLNDIPSHETKKTVDTTDLIEACAEVNPDLLSAEKSLQSQQDASEFLTWLLYEIHEAINDARASGSKYRLYQDESMAKLKTVYGNISEPYTKAMKKECKVQITQAKGLSDPDLAEPIQNLANMEWITHKRENMSVIDNLFTFQCVELQMCSSCYSCMANIQTMSILTLPIPTESDSTSLIDCLKLFVAQEKLQGRDGLQCEKCQNNSISNNKLRTPSHHNMKPVHTAHSDISATPLSPIQPEYNTRLSISAAPRGSNPFLASTPLPGTNRQSAPSLLNTVSSKVITEGIRQSILRRLPECLTIQLLRFNYNPFTKKVCKVRSSIDLILHDLDLNDYTYDHIVEREDMTGISKTNKYSLYALCLHIGGDRTNSGHYLTYAKASDNVWYKFDDELVSPIADMSKEIEKPVVKENCYILFYHKQHEAVE